MMNPWVRELPALKKCRPNTAPPVARAQSDDSIPAFWQLIARFVQWVIEGANPWRRTHAARRKFSSMTQIEVHGKRFEGAKMNYEGNLA